MDCKQKGALQRSGKRARMEDYRIFFPGMVTDRVIRDWLLDDPENNQGLMPDMVEEICRKELEEVAKQEKSVKWRDPKDMEEVLAECRKAVELSEPYLNKYVIPYDYQPDFRFQAPMKVQNPVTGGTNIITLRGAMDILVRRPVDESVGRLEDEWYVYDVKHTKNEQYWRKTRGQLSFYDLACLLLFGKGTKVNALLQPLCKEPWKVFEMDEPGRDILMKHVLDMAKDIWEDNREPTKDSSMCFNCNVKHACTKFVPVEQPNGKRRVSLIRGTD